jgi:hypothetical protein
MKNKLLKEISILIVIIIVTFFSACRKNYRCRTCQDSNKPPIADAGNDTTIKLPVNSILLDASRSSDDVSIMTYHWTRLTGPASFKISNENASQTLVTELTVGEYIIELEVKDNTLKSAKDLLVVDVVP